MSKAKQAESKIVSCPKEKDNRVEIYALIDPRNKQIKYIGKSTNSKKRLMLHLSEKRRYHLPLYIWIKELARESLVPELDILLITDHNYWQYYEKMMITQYRQTHILLNTAGGGDIPHCDLKTRQQNGRKVAALVHSDPIRKHLWSLKKELNSYINSKSKYVSEDSKELIRVKLRLAYKKRPELFSCWANI